MADSGQTPFAWLCTAAFPPVNVALYYADVSVSRSRRSLTASTVAASPLATTRRSTGRAPRQISPTSASAPRALPPIFAYAPSQTGGTVPPDAKSIGTAIDELIAALEPLEATARQTAIRAVGATISTFRFREVVPSVPLLSFSSGEPSPTDARVAGQVDIRTFKQQKAPASANEMACVLAYYLQHLAPADERKASISAADIDKYFNQADFPLPRRSDQLLVNARAAGSL